MPRPFAARLRAQVQRTGELPNSALRTEVSNGTNGWLSSWGTNAHGEIAGCPPPGRH